MFRPPSLSHISLLDSARLRSSSSSTTSRPRLPLVAPMASGEVNYRQDSAASRLLSPSLSPFASCSRSNRHRSLSMCCSNPLARINDTKQHIPGRRAAGREKLRPTKDNFQQKGERDDSSTGGQPGTIFSRRERGTTHQQGQGGGMRKIREEEEEVLGERKLRIALNQPVMEARVDIKAGKND